VINHLLVLLYPELFQLPWSDQKICSINQLLLMDTERLAKEGAYRKTRSSIREGEDEVFLPAPSEHIGEEMSSLLDWVNRSSTAFDPVIGATVLFHEFESIHPFEDGNGRTGRSLFHVYLQCNGLSNSHLCRFDEQLLKDKELYYQMLMYTDYAAKKKGCDYHELLDFFTAAILVSYESAVADLAKKDLLTRHLDETSSRILVKARERKEWFTRPEAKSWIQGLSEQTIGARLSELVEEGILEAKGETRARRFRFRDPMQELRTLLQPAREARQGKLDV